MGTGAITGYIDLAQLALYAFWIFFFGLVIYLQREGQREGYPLEPDHPGGPKSELFPSPEPKSFLLHDGRTVTVPRPEAAFTGNAFAIFPGEPISVTVTVVGNGLVTEKAPLVPTALNVEVVALFCNAALLKVAKGAAGDAPNTKLVCRTPAAL